MKKFLIMFFFVLASLSFADCTTEKNWISACIIEGAGDVIPILAMISVFAIALLYFFGTMISRAEWILHAKEEFYHLLFSILLIVSFIGIIAFTNTMVNEVFESAKANLNLQDDCTGFLGVQQISTCYMKMMKNDAEKIIRYYSTKYIEYLLDSAQYVSYYGFTKGTTYSPSAYKRTWSMTMDNINNLFVLPAYISIQVQYVFVSFFVGDSNGPSSSSVFTFILPAAFILRFFPVFRDSANLMIAISLGLYVLIPFLIALNGMMYSAVLTNCNDYSAIINDAVLGNCDSTGNFFQVASIYPQAFLLPNMIITIFITYAMAMSKALRMIG